MKYQILILVALISSVLLSGCIDRKEIGVNQTTSTYPIVNVKTVHQDDLLSSCDYTMVYYKTPDSIKRDIVKPCVFGSKPDIHISQDSNESVIVVNERDFDTITDVYITEETFKNNIW